MWAGRTITGFKIGLEVLETCFNCERRVALWLRAAYRFCEEPGVLSEKFFPVLWRFWKSWFFPSLSGSIYMLTSFGGTNDIVVLQVSWEDFREELAASSINFPFSLLVRAEWTGAIWERNSSSINNQSVGRQSQTANCDRNRRFPCYGLGWRLLANLSHA